MALTLTTDERTELERRVRSLKIRSEDARRARVILMLANGDSYSAIEATVPCFRDYINRWRRRFLADRVDGLQPRYRGQPPRVLTPALEYPEAGTRAEDSSQSRREGLAARWPATPPLRALHAVGRSRLRAESRRRDRPVHQS